MTGTGTSTSTIATTATASFSASPLHAVETAFLALADGDRPLMFPTAPLG